MTFTCSCISGDFEKLFVKLQSTKRFLLQAISQYWNNYGLMQYVFGYNLCLNETLLIMLQYVGILIMQFIACLHDQNKSGFFGGSAFIQPIRTI